jgi:hypothetical protein
LEGCKKVAVPITMAVFCLGFSDIVIGFWGLLEGDACLVLVLVGWEMVVDFTCQPSDGKAGGSDDNALANPIYTDEMRNWAAIGRSLVGRSVDCNKTFEAGRLHGMNDTDLLMN